MQKKLKFLSAALAFFSLVAFSGRFHPVVDQERQLNQTIETVAQEAMETAELYLPGHGSEKQLVLNKKMANNNEAEEEESDELPEGYFVDVAKDLYSGMSDEVKDAFRDFSVQYSDNSSITYIYDIFTNDEVTADDFVSPDNEEVSEEETIKENLPSRTKSLEGVLTLSAATMYALNASAGKATITALFGMIKSFFISLGIPLWGLVIALAIVATIIILVIVIWYCLKPHWNEIVNAAVSQAPSGTATTVGNIMNNIGAEANEEELKKAIAITSINTIDKTSSVYHIAYLRDNKLNIFNTPNLTYIQAASVLDYCGYINAASMGITIIKYTLMSDSLQTLIDNFKNLNVSYKKIGIFTQKKLDAAKLAYAFSAYYQNEIKNITSFEPEIGDGTLADGYYYHFHDIKHLIHIWFAEV